MVQKTVAMLMGKHRILSCAASVALVLQVLAFAAVGLDYLTQAIAVRPHLERIVGLLLGGALVLSMISMVFCTYHAVRARKHLNDWGLFLLITWIIPYVGISIYLGGANIFYILLARVKGSSS